jgi:hypothetical protein
MYITQVALHTLHKQQKPGVVMTIKFASSEDLEWCGVSPGSKVLRTLLIAIRVARFILVQYTKPEKNVPNDNKIKNGQW